MMMGTPTLPDVASNDVERLFQLISIVADPGATKKRLEEIAAKLSEADGKIQDAASANVELDRRRDSEKEALRQQRDEHGQKLAAERSQFNNDCATRDDSGRANWISARRRRRSMPMPPRSCGADLQERIAKIKSAVA